MKGVRFASTALAATSLFARSVLAQAPAIEIKGSKFFYSNNGTQFFIKGVAYQQDVGQGGSGLTSTNSQYTDPLADSAACSRDIPYLRQLQTNTIRVYAIDPTADHSQCMRMLADAGIYVIADLSAPVQGQSINRNSPSWDTVLYTRYTAVVDAMANYTNTLGFFAGNEVTNQMNNTDASAFVKASVRDMKRYIASRGYRDIGVGYATNDDADIRANLAAYFDCQTAADSISFWGYNIYSWCGSSSYETSGFAARTREFESYSVPVFFAEYGCNTQGVRTFDEVATLYGPQMTPVWSGGIVYMYFQEQNNYGLVSVSGNSVSTLADFSNLATAIAAVNPSATSMGAYNPTNTALQGCPSVGSTWRAAATPLPPTPNAGLCSCMYNSLGCVVDPGVSATNYANLFGFVCGPQGDPKACNGIAANATTGTYGAYGMCNAPEKLSYVLNQYAIGQRANNNPSACAFSGSASIKSTSSATGTCASLISQAGTAGTGTVTGGGATGTARRSGTNTAAASALSVPGFDFGLLPLAAYLGVAVMTGAGMILL